MRKLILVCFVLCVAASAYGQVVVPPFLFLQSSSSAPAAATVSVVGSATDATSQSTYTFSGVSFGAASSTRYLVLGIAVRNASSTFSISSCTIGGVAATAVATANNTGASVQDTAAIYIASVPTGTSGTVSCVLSTSANRAAITVWSVNNLLSPTANSTNTSIANSPSGALTVSANGVGLAYSVSGTSPFTSPAYTWTNLIKDTDQNIGGVNNASGSSVASAGGLSSTISATISNVSASSVATAFAAWR